jgi:hypothetical protein
MRWLMTRSSPSSARRCSNPRLPKSKAATVAAHTSATPASATRCRIDPEGERDRDTTRDRTRRAFASTSERAS